MDSPHAHIDARAQLGKPAPILSIKLHERRLRSNRKHRTPSVRFEMPGQGAEFHSRVSRRHQRQSLIYDQRLAA